MLKHFFICVLVSILGVDAFGYSLEEVRELVRYDFEFSDAPPPHRKSVAVHPHFQVEKSNSSARSDMMFAVIKDKLSRSGIPTNLGSRSFLEAFKGKVAADGDRLTPDLVQPRLFVYFTMVPQSQSKLFQLKGNVYFIAQDPNRRDFSTSEYKAIWSRTFLYRDLNPVEINEKLVYSVRDASSQFAQFFTKWRDTPHASTNSSKSITFAASRTTRDLPSFEGMEDVSTQGGAIASTPQTQNLGRIQSAAPNGTLQIGLSVGTPALANLHLGLWGIGRVPLMVHASGMYFSPETRGLQADLGWIYDREGSYQQSVGVTGGIFNESYDTTEVTFDSSSRSTTHLVHVHEGKPFVGPTYTSQWGDFRFQAGPAIRVGPGNGQAVRFFIQVGYVPAFAF